MDRLAVLALWTSWVAVVSATSLVFKEAIFNSLPGCGRDFLLPANGTFFQTRSVSDCGRQCNENDQCLAINVCRSSSLDQLAFRCQLVSNSAVGSCTSLSSMKGCSYKKKQVACVNGTWDATAIKCVCFAGYAGSRCDRLIRDCQEGRELGLTGTSHNHLIQPLGATEAFTVRCNFNHGLTGVIDRASHCAPKDGFFSQGWAQLKRQMGDCTSCCFAGMENIYRILNQGLNYTLVVYVEYGTPLSTAILHYPHVRVADEQSGYTLTLGDPDRTVSTAAMDDGFLGIRTWQYCTSDKGCSCPQSAGHAGWFLDGCQEVSGVFDDTIEWSLSGTVQALSWIGIELMRL